MEFDLTTFFFALFLGLFVAALEKVIQQTYSIWKRSHNFMNPYLYMIWMEAVVNLTFSIITFLYLSGAIANSLGFLLGTVVLWAIQTQLLSQIIANRVSLIMTNRGKSQKLKWVLAVSITLVNISVFCIWIPAHMPGATQTQITLNNAWERAEKSFFLLLDLGLNLFFLYLVRSRLISGGLTKYWRLYNFNVGIVVVSTCMDILLLGFLSLPDSYIYVQFAPVAYIVKLNIELTMAVLISKVVRSSSRDRQHEEAYSSSNNLSRRRTQHACRADTNHRDSLFPSATRMDTLISGPTLNKHNDQEYQGPGIMKTVVATVRMNDSEGSTEELVTKPMPPPSG
ncbi:hypothetical protein TCE0_060f19300 [Talaromyces pinophilus]|uniref:Uncharacterized protein n=1 Tax=Talaromyces pinophilus TaxID=128442 RepID=A0A6V8HPR3_TALPI|nr:hypothetical protein TCE0_060f19300 [Talaromyces pinophilus]